jgi:hypothetical protein
MSRFCARLDLSLLEVKVVVEMEWTERGSFTLLNRGDGDERRRLWMPVFDLLLCQFALLHKEYELNGSRISQ